MVRIEALEAKVRALQALPEPGRRRKLRVDAGLSQDDLAQAFDPPTNREAISRWERGERTPTGHRLIQYVEILRRLEQMVAA